MKSRVRRCLRGSPIVIRALGFHEHGSHSGVSSAADLEALRRSGVAGAISGKALLDRLISPEELRPFLPNA